MICGMYDVCTNTEVQKYRRQHRAQGRENDLRKQIVDNEKMEKESHEPNQKEMENALKLETIHAHIPRCIIALKSVDTEV